MRFRTLTGVLAVVCINLGILAVLIIALEYASSLIVVKLSSNIVPSYRLNHVWKPNSVWEHSEWIENNPEYPEPYLHIYNDQSWLEAYNVALEKPADTYRIFYVGDSFTEGTAPIDQSVPGRVEQSLNDRVRDKALNFEVINTGTTSYSPTLYYILCRYVLSDYDPDLIVVNVDMTDDFDDWKYLETLIRDDHGNPWAAPPRNIYKAEYVDTASGPIDNDLRVKIQLYLLKNSYVYNLFLKFFGPETPNEPPVVGKNQRYQRWAWTRHDWDENTQRNVENTLDLLVRLARYTAENDIKLMFTAVPHYDQFAAHEDGTGDPTFSARPHYEIERIAFDNDVPYLNSYEALRDSIAGSKRSAYYYRGDMHFNPAGYALWAEAHIGFLLRRELGLLPSAVYELQ